MVSWWNQAQDPAPTGMWGAPMLPSMEQYQSAQNAYMQQHYATPPGDAQPINYWNGYPDTPAKVNNQYMQPTLDMHMQSHELYSKSQHPSGQNNSNGQHPQSSHNEEINVSAVLSERMRAQQILNNNSFDEEAKQKIAECDLKIKKWNENQESRNPTSNYIKWGDSKKMAEGGVRAVENNANRNNRNQPNVNRVNGPSNYQAEPQFNRDNGKKYLENWNDTMRDDGETMSNRQKKKEFYGMGQAWAREDFFQRLPPTHSPFGLKMLKGMGWRHGQAIGKSKEGHVAPIAVDVRFGRQGLCTKEEKEKYNLGQGRPKPVKKSNPIKNVEGKHPVSLLAEHCMKRQMTMPKYDVVFEYGNFHSKSVLVSVTVAGRTFEPSQPSPYKKHAKSVAATLALKELEFVKDGI